MQIVHVQVDLNLSFPNCNLNDETTCPHPFSPPMSHVSLTNYRNSGFICELIKQIRLGRSQGPLHPTFSSRYSFSLLLALSSGLNISVLSKSPAKHSFIPKAPLPYSKHQSNAVVNKNLLLQTASPI